MTSPGSVFRFPVLFDTGTTFDTQSLLSNSMKTIFHVSGERRTILSNSDVNLSDQLENLGQCTIKDRTLKSATQPMFNSSGSAWYIKYKTGFHSFRNTFFQRYNYLSNSILINFTFKTTELIQFGTDKRKQQRSFRRYISR